MIEIPDTPVLEQIAAVASEPDGPALDRNQVAAVLTAYRAILTGDELGVMRRDPDTGAIALRVADENGLHLWRVMPANGDPVYNDLQPVLGWPIVKVSEV